ncbi:MAG: hypothetical protein C0620_09610 [Desulfuromonas sp.]|nr:MAG: hypothetical protein C0620_09610 [Desulfuromonas sp.]
MGRCFTRMIGVLLLIGLTVAMADAATIPLAVHRQVVAAQQLMEKKLYDQALDVLGADQRDRDHYLIDFTRGNIYLLSERPTEAVPWLQRAVKKQPDYSAAWSNLAQACYRTDRFDEAAVAFERAYVTMEQRQPELLYNAALCYLQLSRWPQARDLLLQLISRPENEVATRWRAALVQVYLNLHQPRLAVEQLEVLAVETTGDVQRRWREVLVQEYLLLEESAVARQRLNRYCNDDGLYPRWWLLLAHLYLDQGKYAEGLVALKVVGYLRPLTDEETRLLGDLHLQLGVPQQAVDYYRQLLEQTPPDQHLVTRLAHASLNLHQPEQALSWVEQGAEDDPVLQKLRGQLLFTLGRYRQAAEVFGRLAAAEVDPGAMWLMQGYAAWNAEQWPLARRALRHAVSYPAQQRQAEILLKQLDERKK